MQHQEIQAENQGLNLKLKHIDKSNKKWYNVKGENYG